MKREAVQHSKLKRLCRRLNLPLWQGIGLLEAIWLLTDRQAPRGDIGKLSDEDIALAIEWHQDEAVLIETLVSCGWLDRDDTHRLIIHDWPDHAQDAVHMRLCRARMYFVGRNGAQIQPRPNRLPKWEREAAEEWYSSHQQPKPTSGIHPNRAHENGNRAHENGNRAHAVTTPWRNPALPRPAPPSPTPPVNTGTSINGGGVNGAKLTAAAVRQYFPTADDEFAVRLLIHVQQALDKHRLTVPSEGIDYHTADSIPHCFKHGQKSQGLFLKTVPQFLVTWIEENQKRARREL